MTTPKCSPLLHGLICLFMLPTICFATIIHVPDDTATIQAAATLASEGDTVLIADGTYTEMISLADHGLMLASEYLVDSDTSHISNTILSALEDQRILTVENSVTSTVQVVGLRFQNGNCLNDNLSGGAIDAEDINLDISQCIFENNQAEVGGAVNLIGGTLSVSDSRFDGNSGFGMGGAISTWDSEFLISRNIFKDNIGWCTGGSVKIFESSGSLEHCTFYNNWCEDTGGAIYCYSEDDCVNTVVFDSNIFINNIATSGGAMWVLGVDTLSITNSIFIHNIADSVGVLPVGGGALHISRDNIEADISNNEFYYNESTKKASVAEFASPARFHDNLLFKNHGNSEYTLCTYVGAGDIATNVEVFNNLFFRNGKQNLISTPDYGGVTAVYTTVVRAFQNDFFGNDPIAAGLPNYSGTLIVTDNYWGDPTGPYHEMQNPGGLGDTVNTNTNCLPFATEPFTTRWYRAPEPLALIAPESGEVFDGDTIQFLWHTAPDSTPHDTINYSLEIADNPDFTDMMSIDTGADTLVNVTDLELETGYYWRVLARDIYDLETYSDEVRQFVVTSVDEQNPDLNLTQWVIKQVYPNPFNKTVQIVVVAPKRDNVNIAIYDLQGRLVDAVHQGIISSGQHSFTWRIDGAAGMYFVRVSTKDWHDMRKIVYVK